MRLTPALHSFVIIAVALAVTAVSRAAVNVGDRPNIQFQSLQGQRITSESLAGKLVVVDFQR
jgi:cytochrome oxidase Cu insertion factor (SCO1/SenC/PrrC family)